MHQIDALAALIERYADGDGVHETPIPRMALFRASQPTQPIHGVQEPSLCLIAQGRKQVMLGEQVYLYDASSCLIVSVDVPVVGQVIEATPDAPYLCLRLDLDAQALASLMLELPAAPAAPPVGGALGIGVSAVTPALVGAACRLLALLEEPGDIGVIAPLVEREILYRLLTGPHGPRLRRIAMAESRLPQVNRAISWIKRHYDRPFSIERLADEAGMSPSALHLHFRAVTAMSPLQYQKQIRLQQARQRILAEGMDAAAAGFSVGYESPSQFSREYARLFGAPPLRDVARLRALPQTALSA
jgi:AraC-like DNA-binding protein